MKNTMEIYSDHEMQYMAPEDADRYECLVSQRVLSVLVTQAEQNQRHNLFHTKVLFASS